jgi:hypothetical protein
MKQVLLTIVLALGLSPPAYASPLEFCKALSDVSVAVAQDRDMGLTPYQAADRLTEKGLEESIAAEILNIVYIHGEGLEPELIGKVVLSSCLKQST